jgi:hypothetical protein
VTQEKKGIRGQVTQEKKGIRGQVTQEKKGIRGQQVAADQESVLVHNTMEN